MFITSGMAVTLLFAIISMIILYFGISCLNKDHEDILTRLKVIELKLKSRNKYPRCKLCGAGDNFRVKAPGEPILVCRSCGQEHKLEDT